MEDKHSRKKSHRAHQDRRQPVSGSTSVAMETPVFGALRERGSGELHKKAQNVLGNYADYQNALDKMDVNDQMTCLVGVTDSSHSTSSKGKVKRSSTGLAPVSGNVSGHSLLSTQLPAVDMSRKDRSKKVKELGGKDVIRKGSSRAAGKGDMSRELDVPPSRVKKKPIIRGLTTMAPTESYKAVPDESSRQARTEDSPVSSLSRVASGDKTGMLERPASRSSNSGESTNSSKTKKLKKKKKIQAESHRGNVTNLAFSRPALEPLKTRPEALSLSGRGANVGHPSSDGDGVGTDGPDTGDVQHMLDELLNPTPLSLVTPIPTPKTSAGPFVFPSLSSGSQGAGESRSNLWRAQAKATTILPSNQQKLKMKETAESLRGVNRTPPNRRTRRRPISAGSGSSSSGSNSSSGESSSSSSDSGSSSSSNSSSSESDVSDAEVSSEDETGKKEARSATTMEYKDEGTRLTLEKLQQISTVPNVAITPLKKTPPHFMSDDTANLSPAKHQPQVTSSSLSSSGGVGQSSLGFSSQTSMGFQLMMPNMKDDQSDSDQSDHFDLGCVVKANSGQNKAEAKQDHFTAGDLVPTPLGAWTQEPSSDAVVKTRQSRQPAVSVLSQAMASPTTLPVSVKTKKKKRKHDEEAAQSVALVTSLKKVRSTEQTVPATTVSLAQSLLVSSSGTTSSLTALSDGRGTQNLTGATQEVGGATRDLTGAWTVGARTSNVSCVAPMNTMTTAPPSPTPSTPLSLMVRIPLSDCKLETSTQQQMPKPKAKVEPYNVIRPAPQRRSTSEGLGSEQEEGRSGPGRDLFNNTSRLRMEEFNNRDMQSSRLRSSHMGNRWERDDRDRRTYGLPSHGGGGVREFSGGRTNIGDYAGTRGVGVDYPRGDYGGGRGGGGDYAGNRGHIWDREVYRSQEECWSDGMYDGTRMEPQRGSGSLGGGRRGYSTHRMDPDGYMQEARRRKKDADKIVSAGLDKAKLYMESVTFFMRHGGAIEEGLGAGSNTPVKRNPYKMYSDTITMIKYCQAMSGDYKPLLVLCLRCQSALHWRMFLIKQANAASLHKDLQDFFLPSKSKSPFPGGGFSPLPSPASVGSTTSTGSGVGGTSDTTSSSVTVPKHIYSKASDYLAMSSHVYTCLELWKLSETYMEQCREFFLNADRKAGLTVHYYSSIFQVASWVEDILKSV